MWDEDDDGFDDPKPTVVPVISDSTRADRPPPAPEQIERPSSRLSDHLTQDQQDRQAVSNDMAGRRALNGVRHDLGPSPRGQEGITSSAVTIHGWDDDKDNNSSSTKFKASSATQTHIGPGYPRLEPSRVYEEMLRRETVRPPVFGGRSKNMQLGSVAESWGTAPTLEIPRGMFQLDDDPPSPPPGVNMTPQEIQAEKARRAMLGIPGEKSGRPSIKDMEKEITDRMRNQKLREERVRSDVSVSEVSDSWCRDRLGAHSPQVRRGPDTRQAAPGWGSPAPTMQDQAQPSLSERLRERDVLNRGGGEDDGW